MDARMKKRGRKALTFSYVSEIITNIYKETRCKIIYDSYRNSSIISED